MANPERYLAIQELERELPYSALEFGMHERNDSDELVASPEWQTLLETVLGRESDRIEDWAGTVYSPQTATATAERPDHIPPRELPLPKRPVQSVQSVTVNGDELAAADYHAEDTHLVLLESADLRRWPTSYRSITVEWTYGFDTVPGSVEDALVRLCRHAIERVDVDGLISESTGDGASYDYRLPAEIVAEARAAVAEHGAPSYYSGAGVI
jgi:hypothetical protein